MCDLMGTTSWGKGVLKKLCVSEEGMYADVDVGVSPCEKLEGA